jgi:hypothetical protein
VLQRSRSWKPLLAEIADVGAECLMKQLIQKVSYISSFAALVLLTIGLVTSNVLLVSIACSCAVLGWLLKQ